MSFQDSYPHLIRWEGVYDRDPEDAGGETVFGITRAFEPGWNGWLSVDALLKGLDTTTADGQKEASRRLAADSGVLSQVQIYYQGVFNQLRLDDCPSDRLDACILGGYVNQGPRVIRWLQEAIAELGVPIVVDKQLGPATMQALQLVLRNPWGEAALFNGLMIRRAKAYSKSKPKFIAGLLNRLFDGA